MSQPEARLVQEIRLALGSETDVCMWKNVQLNAEVWEPGSGKVSRIRGGAGGDGAPDLIGALKPHGRLFALEVKSATGRVRADQATWHTLARSFGAFVCVVRSVDEARAALARARRGEHQ